MDNYQKSSFNLREILFKSFDFYKINFSLFLAISFFGQIINMLITTRRIGASAYPFVNSFFSALGFLISFWGSVALIFAVYERHNGREITIKEAFLAVQERLWPFIAVSMVCFLIIASGLLLLVIPGIYWGVIFSLAGFVVVLEKSSVFEALRISKKLISGFFWKIALLGIIMQCLFSPVYLLFLLKATQGVTYLLFYMASILWAPYATVVVFNVYFYLRSTKKETIDKDIETKSTGRKYSGCLSIFGLVVLIITLSIFWISMLGYLVKQEKAVKFLENVSKKITPVIIFPGGITLDRPEGYFIAKTKELERSYLFLPLKDSSIDQIVMQSFSIRDLGLNIEAISLDDDILIDKIFENIIGRSILFDKVFSGYIKERGELVTINGRQWRRFTIGKKTSTKRRSYGIYTSLVYAIYDDQVLVAYYRHGTEAQKGVHDSIDSIDEYLAHEEIYRILEGIQFPQKT